MRAWLRRLLGRWLAHLLKVDPHLFTTWTVLAQDVEVVIADKRVWVNTGNGCQFRATAIREMTVRDDRLAGVIIAPVAADDEDHKPGTDHGPQKRR
jgi:hypothetical protein